ncbi:MAG: hypothetical protein ACRCSQ_00065 [Bacteroidales bacterium]
MPYRRLPNTDLARIKALEYAIEKDGHRENGTLIVMYKSIQEARNFVSVFKREQQMYQQSYDIQVKASKKYQTQLKTVRLYISHFIQVLNMAVIRKEIRKENKKLYDLDTDDYSVPDLSSETSILKWGQAIINGENERLKSGGAPIYNPTIAKVKVHYNIFAEAFYNQKGLQANTNRNLEKVASMRQKADELILDIWNQVEEFYKDCPAKEKIDKCQEFGVVYYYRPKEKKAIEAIKLQKKLSFND